MTIIVTLAKLRNDYANYLQKENPKISPRAPDSYWDIQGGAMAAIFLDWYANLQLLENSIYPQNAVGDQVDLWLYNRGLSARGGQTYSTINCNVDTPVVSNFIIPAGTIFTDSTSNTNPTNNQYQSLVDITVTDNTSVFTLYAIQPGPNYLEPIGNELTATIGNILYTIVTQSCANGQNEETDQSCIARILASVRIPKGGSRTTDYYEFCLEANSQLPSPIITDAIIIPSFQTVNQISKLGVFPLIGTKITEYQLNQGLLPSTTFIGYSRTPDNATLQTVANYIQNQRLVGLGIDILPNYTYIVAGTNPPPFNNTTPPPLNVNPNLAINVTLADGYNLSTLININSQDQNNNPIVIQLTIEQLIQRETRRSICNQPYGATEDTSTYNIIPASNIITALNYQLGVSGGQLAKVLTNVQLPNSDLQVPTFSQSIAALFYTYDVEAYTNITVALI